MYIYIYIHTHTHTSSIYEYTSHFLIQPLHPIIPSCSFLTPIETRFADEHGNSARFTQLVLARGTLMSGRCRCSFVAIFPEEDDTHCFCVPQRRFRLINKWSMLFLSTWKRMNPPFLVPLHRLGRWNGLILSNRPDHPCSQRKNMRKLAIWSMGS